MKKVLLLLALLIPYMVSATPQNVKTAQYLGSPVFKIYVYYPEKAYIGDTITIKVKIVIEGETEGFIVYGHAVLVTSQYREWGVPFTFVSSTIYFGEIASFLRKPPKGTTITKTFTINATDKGVVVAVFYIRYGKWIEGKPILIKSGSTVVATIPRALEHGDAFAFSLTRVVDEKEEKIIEDYPKLKEEYEKLLAENINLHRLNTFYSTGFFLLLFSTIVLFAYCLSLRSKVRSSKQGS